MKVLAYNLRDGAQHTYGELVNFIQTQQPDILCLQEANDWQLGSPTRLEAFAAATQYDHWQFGDSNTQFKLVTFSKIPLIDASSVRHGFWHSAVKITIMHHDTPLTIWNVHLDPRTEESRLQEVQRLLAIVHKTQEATIITGDLNSLSRADNYSSDTTMALKHHSITKFGSPNPRYDVTDFLKESGMADMAAELRSIHTTIPTTSNHDPAHEVALRLDYLFATTAASRLVEEVRVLKNRHTHLISDHYPLLASLH